MIDGESNTIKNNISFKIKKLQQQLDSDKSIWQGDRILW